jgi:hypothetical protein
MFNANAENIPEKPPVVKIFNGAWLSLPRAPYGKYHEYMVYTH